MIVYPSHVPALDVNGCLLLQLLQFTFFLSGIWIVSDLLKSVVTL